MEDPRRSGEGTGMLVGKGIGIALIGHPSGKLLEIFNIYVRIFQREY